VLAIPVLWLLLGVPGVLLARRLFPGLAGGGVLALLPVGYLASFALLSPVSIVGHLLHAPLWLLSASWVVLSAAGLFQLGRLAYGARAGLGARLRAALREPTRWVECAALLALLADVGLSFLRGTNVAGDALFHIGRVRMLLDHGLNSWDPVIAGPRFAAEYHTNLYHALIASSAQLAGLQAFEGWLGMLGWAKLVIASCSYALAYSVFGKRSHAWLGALFTAAFLGPYPVLAYPNALAAYFVLGQGVMLLVQLLARDAGRAALLGLGALSVVGAELHMLYVAILLLLIGPVLGVVLIRSLRSGDRTRQRLALSAGLVLGLGLPFLCVARFPPEPPPSAEIWRPEDYPVEPPTGPATKPDAPLPETPGGFRRTATHQLMLDPGPWADPRSPAPYLLAFLALGALGLGGRADTTAFRVALGVLGSYFGWLMIPALCELLVRITGAPWIVSRVTVISSVYLNALFPGLLLGVLGKLTERAPVQLLACTAAIAYANQTGVRSATWPRDAYLKLYATGPVERDAHVARLHMYRAVLARNISSGSTVWTEPGQAPRLTALWDCYALSIYAGGGSRGVVNMERRRRDNERMIDPSLPLATRVALVRYYGVTQFFVHNRPAAKRIEKALGPLIVRRDHEGPARVFTIDPRRYKP
jgi:hypothetical protein